MMLLALAVAALLIGLWPQPRVYRHPNPRAGTAPPDSGAAALVWQRPAEFAVVTLLLVAVAVGSWSIASAGPLAVLIARREVRRRRCRRRSVEADRALIALVDSVALQLRSGRVLSSAVREAAQAYAETLDGSLRTLLDRVGAGETHEQALSSADAGEQSASVTLVSSSLAVLERSGGPAVRAIDQLSETLRAQRAASDELRSQASQAAASATALAALPVVFGGFVAFLEPEVAGFYLAEPGGAVCIVGALLLTFGGHEWIDTLIWGRSS